MNWQSTKFKECDFCHNDVQGNFDSSAKLICWSCVRDLCATPQAKLKEAYTRLIEKGNVERAKLLEGFIEKEEEEYDTRAITEKETENKRNSGARPFDRAGYERAVRNTD